MNAVPAPSPLDQKLAALRAEVRALGSTIVCFSGGIDSALLLAVAHDELGDRALGITAVSPSLPANERTEAAVIAREIGAAHELVASHELDDPSYAANNADRCFHCKTELYTVSQGEAQRRGFANVVAGIIVDDLGDYRPGIEAARAHGVRFPLVDAGFTKSDVRAAAAHLGLAIWDKPAAACLSSRIAYGTAVTRERLARIDGLESDLKGMGFRVVRVRYHELESGPQPVIFGRIELGRDELARATSEPFREDIVASGKRHGFHFVTLDLAGYRTGSQNEVLGAQRRLPVVR